MKVETKAIQSESSIGYAGWHVTGAAAGAVFFGFASLLVYTFGIFLKPLAAEFHWSRQAVSLAFGLAAISVAICSPPLGALLDRVPPRRVILPCFAVFGLAFGSLAFLTNHLWQLYAVFIVLGIAGNGTAHLAFSGALATWFQARRGLAFASLMAGGALGAMIWPAVAQRLINVAGWRGAFAIMGALALVCALPLTTRIKARREHSARSASTQSIASPRSTAAALLSRPFWIIVIVLFAASLGQNGSIAHLSAALTDRGVSPAMAASAVSALGGATLVGRLVTGWLLDRYFAPHVSICLLAIGASGTFILAHAHSAALGFLAALSIGLGMGGEADMTPYLLSRYFQLNSFSTLYGFSWTAYALAGAVGPVIMGRAFDATGSYTRLLVALSGFTFVTALLLLLLPRYDAGRQTADLMLPDPLSG